MASYYAILSTKKEKNSNWLTPQLVVLFLKLANFTPFRKKKWFGLGFLSFRNLLSNVRSDTNIANAIQMQRTTSADKCPTAWPILRCQKPVCQIGLCVLLQRSRPLLYGHKPTYDTRPDFRQTLKPKKKIYNWNPEYTYKSSATKTIVAWALVISRPVSPNWQLPFEL